MNQGVTSPEVTPFFDLRKKMGVTVSDIVRIMEEVAPTECAESWDNPGLQVGHLNQNVSSIMVSLDPGPEVMRHAAESSVDMIICHHPLLFRPLKKIDLGSTVGEIIGIAIRSDIALYAAHTNLDSAEGGLNDCLAGKIGLKNVRALVPGTHSEIENITGAIGLGRIGLLAEEMPLELFCRDVKKRLGLEKVRMTGDGKMTVKHIALCTGSGGSLLPNFFDSEADLFVTGDVNYHDALEVIARGRAILDIGHFGSEHIMVEQIGKRLGDIMKQRFPDVHVAMYDKEKDPFVTI